MWSYSLEGKWKMIFPKKIHGNMIFSSTVLKRWFFQKNLTDIWSFLYHQERYISFSQKYDIFSVDGKWKMIFLKKYMEIWCFLLVNTLKDDISSITEKDDTHPRKYDIGIPDEHSRKSSNDSLYFYGDLFRCFNILFSRKEAENFLYRTEILLYL